MTNDELLLFIEPENEPSDEPVIDMYTRRMTSALRNAKEGVLVRHGRFEPGGGYRGFHTCSCGATSSNCEHQLQNGEITNSLAVHYLAMHRDEVPEEQLARVAKLTSEEIVPAPDEIWDMSSKGEHKRNEMHIPDVSIRDHARRWQG